MDKETIENAAREYVSINNFDNTIHSEKQQGMFEGYCAAMNATKHLTEQLALKDAAHSDLGNKYSHLLEQLAEANGCIERQAIIYHEQD